MKFRMFTEAARGEKIAVNVDKVLRISVASKSQNTTYIYMDFSYQDEDGTVETVIEVLESFDVVLARLNTIAE